MWFQRPFVRAMPFSKICDTTVDVLSYIRFWSHLLAWKVRGDQANDALDLLDLRWIVIWNKIVWRLLVRCISICFDVREFLRQFLKQERRTYFSKPQSLAELEVELTSNPASNSYKLLPVVDAAHCHVHCLVEIPEVCQYVEANPIWWLAGKTEAGMQVCQVCTARYDVWTQKRTI